jgi:hypothetical protein
MYQANFTEKTTDEFFIVNFVIVLMFGKTHLHQSRGVYRKERVFLIKPTE